MKRRDGRGFTKIEGDGMDDLNEINPVSVWLYVCRVNTYFTRSETTGKQKQ